MQDNQEIFYGNADDQVLKILKLGRDISIYVSESFRINEVYLTEADSLTPIFENDL